MSSKNTSDENSYSGLTLYKPPPGRPMERVLFAEELRKSTSSFIEVDCTYDSWPLPSNILVIIRGNVIVIKRTNGEILYIIRIKGAENHKFELHYNSKL